jgi:hypothetical protein
MTYDEIFEAYYTLYRAEAVIPDDDDDEYTIALRLANEALTRWANYDNTFWQPLFTTAVESGDAGAIATDVTAYDAPEDFKAAGGDVRILDSSGKVSQRYPIYFPHEPQFKDTQSTYAYFSGSPSEGYVLNINPAPSSTLNGQTIQYDYYKSPSLYTTGSSVSEIPNPYFVVHRMLANRFRASRNPYYEDALRDAEEALKIMKMENDSGNWSHPWKVSDYSGTSWGQ